MKKLSVFVLTAILVSVLCIIGSACGKSAEIRGAVNIEMSYKETAYDFLDGVTCENQEVTYSTDVEFGKAGIYNLTYKAGEATVNATVKIYGEPKVSAKDVTMSYKDAADGSTEGITVIDSFGETLEPVSLGVVGNYGYFRFGGVYTVRYAASDKVGNTVEFTRKINIEKQNETDFGEITVDLLDSFNEFEMEGEFVCLADVQGNIYKNVNYEEGGFKGLNTVCRKLGIGKHSLTLVTDQGYGKLSVAVQDNKELCYKFDYGHDREGINNYLFVTGEEIYFPQIVNDGNSQQVFDVEYQLYDSEGNQIEFSEFDNSVIGSYTYKAIITHNDKTVTEENVFYVVTEKEKYNNMFSVNSNQFLGNYRPNYSEGSTFEYVGEVSDSYGVTYNAVKFQNNSRLSATEQNLGFSPDVLGKIMTNGSSTLTMKVKFANNITVPANDPAWVMMYAFVSDYNCSNNYEFHINSDGWTTLTYDLKTCWLRPQAGDFYSVDYYGNYTIRYPVVGLWLPYNYCYEPIYIADVRFGDGKKVIEQTFYDFTSGETVSVGNDGVTIGNSEESTLIDDVRITENGLIKRPNANSDSNPLTWDLFAEINGDTLTYEGKEYISFTYNKGEIMKGKADTLIHLDAFGDPLNKYQCETVYKLYYSDGTPVSGFDQNTMAMTLKEGGYYLSLEVIKDQTTTVFNKPFFVTTEDCKLNTLVAPYLRYYGYDKEVDNEVFELYTDEKNIWSHREIRFGSELVSELLDKGYTDLGIVFMPLQGLADDFQCYRLEKDSIIGVTEGFIHVGEGEKPNYQGFSSAQYGTWYDLKALTWIDESVRNTGSVGFTSVYNARLYFKYLFELN